MKSFPLAGCCGTACSMCQRYHSEESCKGCIENGVKTSCSTYKCCHDDNNLETCAECRHYPCAISNGVPNKNIVNADQIWFADADRITDIEKISSIGIEHWYDSPIEKSEYTKFILNNFYFDKKEIPIFQYFQNLKVNDIRNIIIEAVEIFDLNPLLRQTAFIELVKDYAFRNKK